MVLGSEKLSRLGKEVRIFSRRTDIRTFSSLQKRRCWLVERASRRPPGRVTSRAETRIRTSRACLGKGRDEGVLPRWGLSVMVQMTQADGENDQKTYGIRLEAGQQAAHHPFPVQLRVHGKCNCTCGPIGVRRPRRTRLLRRHRRLRRREALRRQRDDDLILPLHPQRRAAGAGRHRRRHARGPAGPDERSTQRGVQPARALGALGRAGEHVYPPGELVVALAEQRVERQRHGVERLGWDGVVQGEEAGASVAERGLAVEKLLLDFACEDGSVRGQRRERLRSRWQGS